MLKPNQTREAAELYALYIVQRVHYIYSPVYSPEEVT